MVEVAPNDTIYIQSNFHEYSFHTAYAAASTRV